MFGPASFLTNAVKCILGYMITLGAIAVNWKKMSIQHTVEAVIHSLNQYPVTCIVHCSNENKNSEILKEGSLLNQLTFFNKKVMSIQKIFKMSLFLATFTLYSKWLLVCILLSLFPFPFLCLLPWCLIVFPSVLFSCSFSLCI